jgi:hypothetical protein
MTRAWPSSSDAVDSQGGTRWRRAREEVRRTIQLQCPRAHAAGPPLASRLSPLASRLSPLKLLKLLTLLMNLKPLNPLTNSRYLLVVLICTK